MECKHCGYCCTLKPRISLFEIFRILLKGHRNFIDKDTKGRKYIKLIDGDCFFLKRIGNKTECRIYPIKPKVCREYPGNDITCEQRRKEIEILNNSKEIF